MANLTTLRADFTNETTKDFYKRSSRACSDNIPVRNIMLAARERSLGVLITFSLTGEIRPKRKLQKILVNIT